MATGSQLVGRKAELAQLREGLSAGRHQLIVGEAGVGKTRLAIEAISSLAGANSNWKRVTGSPNAGAIPLAAFASFAPDLLGVDVVRAVLATLPSEKRDSASPAYLLVDDAQWLDDASATVVHQLCIDGRMRLILTMRSGEPVPAAVAAFLRNSDFDVTALRSLTHDELRALLRSALGGPVDGATEARLLHAAGDNTFFLVELVNGALAAGLLSLVGGLWRLSGDHPFAPLLEDVVRSKFEPLSTEARDVAEMIALAGSLPVQLLTTADFAEAVEQLERVGLVRFSDQEVSLDHPLYAEVLTRRLPRLARLRHFSLLADMFEAHGVTTRQTRLQTALWRLETGAQLTHERLLGAATDAKDAGDTALAARFGAAAFEKAPAAESALLASWCLAEQGDHRGALKILRAAATVATDFGQQAAIGMRIAEELWWGERDVTAALQALATTRASLGTQPEAAVLDAQGAVFKTLRGHCREALDSRALVEHPISDVRSVSALAIALSLTYSDAAAEGVAVSERAFERALADPPKVVGDPGTHLVSRTLGLLHSDRVVEATALADFIYEATIFFASRQARAWAAAVRGQSELHAGRLVESWRDLREATTLWVDCSLFGLAQWCASGAVLAAAARGDVQRASESMQEAAQFDATGFEILNVTFARARTWTGGDDEGLALSTAIAEASHLGNFTEAINGVVDLARLGFTDAAARMMPEVPWRSEAAELRRRFVTAIVSPDAEHLEQIGDDFGRVGVRVLQAESYALASMAFREVGDGRRSTACESHAKELALATQALTPLLHTLLSSPVLSAREYEIALLVKAGQTNRQIAAQLFLSERTVENHLYRAFRKLGVTSRDELAILEMSTATEQ